MSNGHAPYKRQKSLEELVVRTSNKGLNALKARFESQVNVWHSKIKQQIYCIFT